LNNHLQCCNTCEYICVAAVYFSDTHMYMCHPHSSHTYTHHSHTHNTHYTHYTQYTLHKRETHTHRHTQTQTQTQTHYTCRERATHTHNTVHTNQHRNSIKTSPLCVTQPFLMPIMNWLQILLHNISYITLQLKLTVDIVKL